MRKESKNSRTKSFADRYNLILKLAVICVLIATVAALNSAVLAQGQTPNKRGVGAVFVLTNARQNNGVAIFSRETNGALRAREIVSTGGRGTGGLLDAQGSLILSEGGEWLFAVNALSNEISVFAVTEDARLRLVSKAASGGERPISLTVSEDLLYVLNSGGAGNITAFNIGANGALTQIADSSRPLSTPASAPCPRPTDAGRICSAAGPAQVQFSPNGDVLVVTERLTGRILSYAVGDDGRAAPSNVFQGSAGSMPFGFDFAQRGRLVVAYPIVDLPNNIGGFSSSMVSETGIINPLGVISSGGALPCWVSITPSGRHAIGSNPADGSLATITINDDGSLSLLNARAGDLTGGDPRDLDLTDNGRFLYVLNNMTAVVSAFRVEGDGTLIRLALNAGSGFPPGAAGIAAQ
jgi:6-phosphogluconolactonase